MDQQAAVALVMIAILWSLCPVCAGIRGDVSPVDISGDAHYVAALPRIGTETSATIQLVAVSPDGTETLSNNTTTVLDWQ
jgi:hypothetical protein